MHHDGFCRSVAMMSGRADLMIFGMPNPSNDAVVDVGDADCFVAQESAQRELGDSRFARLKAPLRLRYAIDKGFEPGLWAPSDVEESRPEDRSFGGRLKNLGTQSESTFKTSVPASLPGRRKKGF
jgi:hypothetical protein